MKAKKIDSVKNAQNLNEATTNAVYQDKTERTIETRMKQFNSAKYKGVREVMFGEKKISYSRLIKAFKTACLYDGKDITFVFKNESNKTMTIKTIKECTRALPMVEALGLFVTLWYIENVDSDLTCLDMLTYDEIFELAECK